MADEQPFSIPDVVAVAALGYHSANTMRAPDRYALQEGHTGRYQYNCTRGVMSAGEPGARLLTLWKLPDEVHDVFTRCPVVVLHLVARTSIGRHGCYANYVYPLMQVQQVGSSVVMARAAVAQFDGIMHGYEPGVDISDAACDQHMVVTNQVPRGGMLPHAIL